MTRSPVSLCSNKHGVTETVAYVALIIIAFGISVLLYSYLQLNAPKERPACPEGVSLGVSEVSCTLLPKKQCTNQQGGTGRIEITLANNGRRSVSGAYLRLGAPNQNVKELLNKETPFFRELTDTGSALLPGKTFRKTYALALENEISTGEQELEIEPITGEGKNIALCEQAVFNRKIRCDYPGLQNLPATMQGAYSRIEARAHGAARMEITPLSKYAEGINYMEVALCRFSSGGSCTPQDTSPRKVECPDSNGQYNLQWGGLSSGNYEMRATIVMHDGTHIPVTQGASSSSVFSFTIVGCIGECTSGWGGASITANGQVKCSYPDECLAGNTVAKRYFCNWRCYTGDPALDRDIIITDAYQCLSPGTCSTSGGYAQCTESVNYLGSTSITC